MGLACENVRKYSFYALILGVLVIYIIYASQTSKNSFTIQAPNFTPAPFRPPPSCLRESRRTMFFAEPPAVGNHAPVTGDERGRASAVVGCGGYLLPRGVAGQRVPKHGSQ